MKNVIQSSLFAAFTLSALLFTACSDRRDGDDRLIVPTEYDGTDFAANTATESSITAQLDALTAEMRKGRTAGVTVDYNTLLNLYGSDLRNATTPYYLNRSIEVNGWLQELAKASGNTWTPGDLSGQGGVYGSYLFDEYGLEYEQVVQKGLFAAALYNHAVSRMQGTITESTPDQLLKMYGATPAFKNSDNATKHGADADKYQALYAARRDKNDGTGVYLGAKGQFITLQAAIQGGAQYQFERNQALEELRLYWEKANGATIINYLHSSIAALSNTNPTDAQKSGALHSISEIVGFLHGWRTIPQAYRRITDAQIDEYLLLVNAPHNGTPALYRFATEPVSELPKLVELMDKLQNLYNFTNQEVEDFKKNWVAEQGR